MDFILPFLITIWEVVPFAAIEEAAGAVLADFHKTHPVLVLFIISIHPTVVKFHES